MTDPYQTSHAVTHSIGVATDNLHCLRAAVQEAQSLHSFGPYNLVRASIEASATACYMLGPSSRNERVWRRFRLAAKDAKAADEAEELAGGQASGRRVGRVQDVARRRAGLDASVLGARPVSYTTVVREGGAACAVGQELAALTYSACSGLAHGQSWATLSLLDRDQVEELTGSVLQVRITAGASRVNLVVAVGILFAAEARRLQAARSQAP